MDNGFRIQPHDKIAERSVLGAIMLDKQALNLAEEKLNSNDFFDEKNREIFKAIMKISERGETPDLILVKNELESLNQFEFVGGIDNLMNLTENVGLISNIGEYCNIVKENSIKRELIKVSDRVLNLSYDTTSDVNELLDIAEQGVFSISENNIDNGLTHLSASVFNALELIEERAESGSDITGVPTGYYDLDKKLNGLQKSDLILLAGRPSMGKTALGINMAVNASLKEHPVAIFSLEMSKLQVSQRIMSQLSFINLSNIINGKLSTEQWEKLGQTISVIEQLPIYIDDTPSITVSELRAKCRRMKMEHGLSLIVVDYLQLMRSTGRRDNRQNEVAEISRGLKALAKDMDCPVLALSQLSRAVELRENKRPMLSDLRESGAIEQDADIVMMLYRDDYYYEDSNNPNVTEVLIEKHRNGATGMVELMFHKEITTFSNLARGVRDGR